MWKDEIILNKLEVSHGNIILDLQVPPTALLGSGGEQFAIEALKHIFFQFGKVSSIELLMGHIDLERPMIRSEDREH
ncbi:hypothetical protein ACWHAM_25415 [Paenibacillus terrae]